MTPEQIQQLSDDEIRVRVAELMGWKHSPSADHAAMRPWVNQSLMIRVEFSRLPNYPADLNACHDLELTLSIDHASEYGQALIAIRSSEHWASRPPAGDHYYHFSARARCEAFLAVMQQPTE